MKLTEQQQALLRWLVRRAWSSNSPYVLPKHVLLFALATDPRVPSLGAHEIDEAMTTFEEAGLVEVVHDRLVPEYKLTGWAERLVPPEFYGSDSKAQLALQTSQDDAQHEKALYMAEFINSSLRMEDIEWLCFELGIDYENLGGDTKKMKAKNLVEELRIHGKLELLDKKLLQKRSGNYKRQFET